MALTDAAEWHGWSHENRALFITPLDEERVGVYVQQGRDVQCAAVFIDPAMAMIVMDFLDQSLMATGEANSVLVDRLRSEQPLAFPPQVMSQGDAPSDEPGVPADTEELFGELGRQ